MNPFSASISKRIRNKKPKLESNGPANPEEEKEPSFYERHFIKFEVAGIHTFIIIFTTVFIGVSTCLPLYPFAPIALGILLVAALIVGTTVGS